MFKKYGGVALFVIFLLVLGARLYFAFSTPFFSSDDAYFNLRQIENIKSTGLPFFKDDLSYSGNSFIFSPVFHYIIAFFALFMPVSIAAKLLPNIFASSVIFLAYLIGFRISKNKGIGVLIGFISGFVPIFFADLNNISVYSLVFPLILLLLYLFMHIRNKSVFYYYILILVFLSFLHPFVLVFCMGLLLYQILLIIGNLQQDGAEIEISLFSVFFVLWAQFLLYKKLFLFHGINVIWQNIPAQLLSENFSSINALEAIYMVGVVPLIYGIYLVFRYLFKENRKDVYLLISFALLTGLLLWIRLIELKIGLMFFGLILVLLFSQYFKIFLNYVKQTRASNFLYFFIIFVIIAFVITSVFPSLVLANHTIGSYVTKDEVDALAWLREKTPEDSVIVASIKEGNLITAIANRKNVIDYSFFLRTDVEQRLKDVEKIFISSFEIEVVDLMNKYNADYIYFSPKIRSFLNINFLPYVSSGKCFEKIYGNNKVSIYHKIESCQLKVVA
ncbi:hypothetical protein JW851_01640 [Candidatus Woesearchaeota archaeon]|nr:hypothetical protein [Candidatus Woesearchaeota archaeon]